MDRKNHIHLPNKFQEVFWWKSIPVYWFMELLNRLLNPLLSPQIREHRGFFCHGECILLVYSEHLFVTFEKTLVNAINQPKMLLEKNHSAAKGTFSFQSMPEFTVPRCLVLDLKQQVPSTVLIDWFSGVLCVCGWQMEFLTDLPIGNVLKRCEFLRIFHISRILDSIRSLLEKCKSLA